MSIVRLPSFKHAIRLGPVWAGAGALLLFCLGVLFPAIWLSLGVYHMAPYFCDLHAVLGASDAVAAGADPFAVPNPFDVMGRPHVYGPAWLSLHHLGLSRQDVPWLGVLLLASVPTLGAVWLAPRTWGDTLLATAWLASPPFLLAYERGNNDLVIVLLLALTGLMTTATTRWRGLGNGLTGIALLAATLLKFYPAAGAGALLATGSRRASLCRLLLGVGITTLLVSWQWPLFAAAFRVTPTWETVYGFGLPVIARFFRLLPDAAPWFAGGALLALAALGCVVSRTRFRRWIAVLLRDPGAAAWMVAAGGAWVACFQFSISGRFVAGGDGSLASCGSCQ